MQDIGNTPYTAARAPPLSAMDAIAMTKTEQKQTCGYAIPVRKGMTSMPPPTAVMTSEFAKL